MLRIPRSFEYLYAIFALWFFFGNPITLILSGGTGSQLISTTSADSNFLLPGISMMIASAAALILINQWQHTLTYIKGNPQALLLAALVLLILSSAQWSGFPNYTFRRSILLLGSTIFTAFFTIRFDFRSQLKILTIAFCAAISLCFLMSVFFPNYGIMGAPHEGAWRGVHMHKNRLGAQMGFISIFLLVVRSTHLFRGFAKGLVSLFAVGALVLVATSTSTTGVVLIFVLLIVSYLCNTLRLGYRYQVPITNASLATIILLGLYIQANLPRILGWFGKGTDLTGRDDLWPTLLRMASLRPLLGYGYEGFWRGSTSPGSTVWKALNWPVPNAHNGFLDMVLAIGLLGGALFSISLILNLLKVFLRVQITNDARAICPAIALVFLIISNTTETALFINDSWILYVWISLLPLQPERLEVSSPLERLHSRRELTYTSVRQQVKPS